MSRDYQTSGLGSIPGGRRLGSSQYVGRNNDKQRRGRYNHDRDHERVKEIVFSSAELDSDDDTISLWLTSEQIGSPLRTGEVDKEARITHRSDQSGGQKMSCP